MGIVVGTWLVSFVCWDNVDRSLCLSPSLCRDPRDPFARGFAAVPGPDDRPAIKINLKRTSYRGTLFGEGVPNDAPPRKCSLARLAQSL